MKLSPAALTASAKILSASASPARLPEDNTSAQEGKVSKEALTEARDKILELTGVLGILLDLEDAIPEEITELANKRAEAKKAKDYALADQIRDEIQSKGYTVKDVPGGFKIEKAN